MGVFGFKRWKKIVYEPDASVIHFMELVIMEISKDKYNIKNFEKKKSKKQKNQLFVLFL